MFTAQAGLQATTAMPGRKGSLIADQYVRGERIPKDGVVLSDKHPTNEEVAKAVQQKVAAAVEMSRKYRHVAWYSLFVAAYMVVLYLQASAYKSGDVVQTLKKAFLPEDGSTTMTFSNEDEVLNYLGSKVLLPIWKDPVCGDGNCEWPWEFPAWGRFGCKADCGQNPNTTAMVVNVRADFTGHPSISPRVLMSNAKWNLCLNDDARRKRGEADLCWYADDQGFDQTQVNSINAATIIDGSWYVVVKGDYAGRVAGAIYDITNSSSPLQIPTTPEWKQCVLNKKQAVSSTTTAVRRLLQAYTQAHQVGGEEGQRILKEAVQEIQNMPELKRLRQSKAQQAQGQQQQQGQAGQAEAPKDATPLSDEQRAALEEQRQAEREAQQEQDAMLAGGQQAAMSPDARAQQRQL